MPFMKALTPVYLIYGGYKMSRIRLIQTARDTGDRLTEKAVTAVEELTAAIENTTGLDKTATGVKLALKPDSIYQRIAGFGGAFTESSAYTFYRMPVEKRREILRRYFDPDEGIGYSLGRVHINSCDFSLMNYTYVKENDKELKSFDISREEMWTIPMIKEAEAVRGGGIRLLASPWSPPGWMKSNGEMNNGGMLLPQFRACWAAYYTKYIKAMRARGADIMAVTVQNEPAAVQTWDSCIYSAEDEGLFVRDYLGPALEKEGLSDVKIYVWDHNRDILVERAVGTLGIPGADRYIYGIADHWYCSEAFENLTRVHELFPDKHLLFSEGCQEGGVQLGSWTTGERYGRNMIGDFNNWQEGWLDWNIILDETGGPNHAGNLCDAPVIADTATQEIYYNSSYYYIGHFSRFVKPGAVRIGIDAVYGAQRAILQHAAFMNDDGTAVLIVMNETDGQESFSAELDTTRLSYVMPAHSIATVIFQ